MPRTSNLPVRGATRNGQSVWTEHSFLGQAFWSLWQFHNFLGIRTTNLICQIIDFQGICCPWCYCVLSLMFQTWIGSPEVPSLAKNPNSEARWSSSSRSISQVKGYSDRKYSRLLPLVTLALSGTRGGSPVTSVPTTQIFFLWNLWEWTEGLGLITQGKKSHFPDWPALHHLFCYHLYSCGDAGNEHCGFMFVSVLLW